LHEPSFQYLQHCNAQLRAMLVCCADHSDANLLAARFQVHHSLNSCSVTQKAQHAELTMPSRGHQWHESWTSYSLQGCKCHKLLVTLTPLHTNAAIGTTAIYSIMHVHASCSTLQLFHHIGSNTSYKSQ